MKSPLIAKPVPAIEEDFRLIGGNKKPQRPGSNRTFNNRALCKKVDF
jgi:hypothetical protein